MNIKSNSFFTQKTEVKTQFTNSKKTTARFIKNSFRTVIFAISVGPLSNWILASNFWNDGGVWDDFNIWND